MYSLIWWKLYFLDSWEQWRMTVISFLILVSFWSRTDSFMTLSFFSRWCEHIQFSLSTFLIAFCLSLKVMEVLKSLQESDTNIHILKVCVNPFHFTWTQLLFRLASQCFFSLHHRHATQFVSASVRNFFLTWVLLCHLWLNMLSLR